MAKQKTVTPPEETTEPTTVIDGAQNETTPTEPVTPETTDESLAGELKSVDQVVQHAKDALGADNTPIEPDADKLVDSTEPLEAVKFDKEAIAEIIKNNDLKTMDKLEKIVKLLPQPANKLVQGLRGLFDQLGYDRENSVGINIEQKAFYRNFKALLKLPQSEFDEQFRYVNWMHKQLVDVELLKKEGLIIVGGVSPIHIMNVFKFIANKDDVELQSFVYLFTILDARVTDTKNALKGKNVDLSKSTIKTNFTAEDIEKLNKYYNAD